MREELRQKKYVPCSFLVITNRLAEERKVTRPEDVEKAQNTAKRRNHREHKKVRLGIT